MMCIQNDESSICIGKVQNVSIKKVKSLNTTKVGICQQRNNFRFLVLQKTRMCLKKRFKTIVTTKMRIN